MKHGITINDGHDIEVIPSSSLAQMLCRLAERGDKSVEVVETPDKPRWAKVAGTVVTLVVAVMISIGLILNWVK